MTDAYTQGLGEEFLALARVSERAAEVIIGEEEVVVASHVDADGLTSAGIISAALDRAEIERETLF